MKFFGYFIITFVLAVVVAVGLSIASMAALAEQDTAAKVRRLLHHPHFSEGIFNVREWDYVFNFYTGDDNAYLTCQYKLKFDGDNRVESTHWKNPQCPVLLVPIVVEEEDNPS